MLGKKLPLKMTMSQHVIPMALQNPPILIFRTAAGLDEFYAGLAAPVVPIHP